MSAGTQEGPAVAFFIFNRPELTERVFRAIAAARPRRLLVVADGPRDGYPADPGLVARARAVIERVDWPCEVLTDLAPRNLGCRDRIATGLDWVFGQVEEAILLEDDTEPDASFFQFCAELLDRYRQTPEVHMICGCDPLPARQVSHRSYRFSRTYNVWGWATWRRAWAHYDLEMRRWPELRETGWLRGLLGDATEARIVSDMFDRAHAGQVPTWDFQWVYSSWLNGGCAALSELNLVRNIGFGELASHEHAVKHPNARLRRHAVPFPLRHPDRVEVDHEADHAMWRHLRPTAFASSNARGAGGPHRPRPRAARPAPEPPVGPGRAGEEIVIGSAIGQPVAYVAPFLDSLRRSGYRGDVTLIVDRHLGRALTGHPLAEGVTLIGVPRWPPLALGLLDRPRLLRWVWRPLEEILWRLIRLLERLPNAEETPGRARYALAGLLLSPMEARFPRFDRVLARAPHRRVLLSDVRDVLFQSDPFRQLPDAGLCVSIEAPRYTIATEPHNAKWVTRVFGPSLLRQIGDQRVANVGVVAGDGSSVARYLTLMTRHILRCSPGRLGLAGTDMAVLNMLLWTGRLGRVELLDPLESPVATLNGVPAEDLRLTPEGRLASPSGREPAVLHQYDRQPEVAGALRRALAPDA